MTEPADKFKLPTWARALYIISLLLLIATIAGLLRYPSLSSLWAGFGIVAILLTGICGSYVIWKMPLKIRYPDHCYRNYQQGKW